MDNTKIALHSTAVLQATRSAPIVRLAGYTYLVDFGAGVRPRLHTVHKDRTCACGQSDCPAVQAVADWLKHERTPAPTATQVRVERAPEPPIGYTPFLPQACPVCGAAVRADHELDSRTRGIGWRCAIGGATHFWQTKWEALKGWFFRPEIIPGVLKREDVVPDGAPMGYLPSANGGQP